MNNVICSIFLLNFFLFSCENLSHLNSEETESASDKLFKLAYSEQWDEFVNRLDHYEGDIDVVDPYKQTLLIVSSYKANENTIKKIIEKGANVNKATKSGNSPLHASAYNNNAEVTQLLIDAGAKIDILDDGGLTPLHMAAARKSYEVMSILLEKGADPNLKDKYGWAPLQCLLMSSQKPSLESVEILLKYGADPNYKNPNPTYADSSFFSQEKYPAGETALEIAEDGNYTDIIELLKKYGAVLPKNSSDEKIE